MDSASSISSMEEIALHDTATPVVSRQGGFIVPDFVHNRNFLTDGGHCLLQELDCLLPFSIYNDLPFAAVRYCVIK